MNDLTPCLIFSNSVGNRISSGVTCLPWRFCIIKSRRSFIFSPIVLKPSETNPRASCSSLSLTIPIAWFKFCSPRKSQNWVIPWIRSHLVTRTYTGNLAFNTSISSSKRILISLPYRSSSSVERAFKSSAPTVTTNPFRGSFFLYFARSAKNLCHSFLSRS